ncbi:hypothetical protein CFN78_18415 [Amycolatopsis antarctica]|uniref:Thioesterase TesA-like domain-containing protein n=1 Tax=Amycolatopsis antarctica TaxID=1854586 RepID=A0A263D041_9PSEU|nr:alpha/beta fold hydrolase [Amycolatopsis antarctica]OZM71803.1 hypothetical protein CFN78_18415 [Amycolatopsis antarctica]
MTTTSDRTMPGGGSAWVLPAPGVAPAGRPLRPRLICFAYAGRGASVFQAWQGLLGDTADVCSVQLPAREERLHDAPVTEVAALRQELLPRLRPWLDGPFVLFGHCMGALLAADLAVALRADDGIEPDALILSGAAPPWQQESLGDDLGAMTDGEFIRGLRKAGALTARQIAEPAALALMLPAIRADYQLFESTRRQRPRPSVPPLRCPMSLFAGDADAAILPEQVRDWGALSAGRSELTVFAGDHFFLETAAELVAGRVGDEIRRVCR